MYILPLGLTLLLTAFNVTAEEPTTKIIPGIEVENGELVKAGEFEEVVKLNNGCSATVVGPNTVITAAHCVKVGRPMWFDKGKERHAIQMFVSPKSKGGGKGHDLAAGVFSPEIPFGQFQFAVVEGDPKQGDKATITGYGCVTSGGSGSGVLRKGDAEIVGIINEYEFLMQGKVRNCPGDSGSGVFYTGVGYNKLIGVVSKRSAPRNSYQVNLSHPASKEFIETMIEVAGAKVCGYNYDCRPTNTNAAEKSSWGAIIY